MRGQVRVFAVVVLAAWLWSVPAFAQDDAGAGNFGEIFGQLVSPTPIAVEPVPPARVDEGAQKVALRAMGFTEAQIEDQIAQEPGWYLEEDVPANATVVKLRRQGQAVPPDIATAAWISLAPKEVLYPVVSVSTTPGEETVTLGEPTRRAYAMGKQVVVVLRPVEKLGWLAGPSVTDAENLFITSLSAGGSYRGVEVTLSHGNTDAQAGGKDIESRSGKLKVPLLPRRYKDFNNQLAFAADSTRVRHIRYRHRALLSGNLGIDGGLCYFQCKTNLTANLGWGRIDPEVGEQVNDLLVGVGVSHKFRPTVVLSADYSLKNDLDREDGFSLTVTKLLAAGADGRLIFGARKHGALFATYVATF